MSTSLPPVILPRNVWVDIYAETGIAAGTKLIIQNIGRDETVLTESATQPTSGYGLNKLPSRQYVTNEASNVGAWAYSSRGTKLQVEEAS
ncbi:MAG TPA: hypothetical protein EYN54_02120 [Methylococcaceae bacterium]|nr:hypothetical protein [Methylococcaceae bacterium]